MSGTTPRIVPEINLDEFERRLRAAGAPSTGVEDPLAELTRLVNAVHSDARRPVRPPDGEGRAAPPESDDEPETGPVPAFVAPLRPAFAESNFAAGTTPVYPPVADEAEQPERSRGWTVKIVGLALVGVALIGGAMALRHGVILSTGKSPPFIAADDAPTKVQPPDEATVQSSGDIAALLMKDSATPTTAKVVSNEEQPVDLRAQSQPAAPAAVAPATPVANAGSPVANAPDTPVVPPAAPSASVAPLFPAAKPVKTVTVRPDGTLIAPELTPTAASPTAPTPTPPAKTTVRAIDAVVASPEAATPKLDLPTKLSPSKPAGPVVAKTDTTAPAAATDATPSAPLQLGAPRPAKPAKPAPVKAVAEAAPTDADAAPTNAPAAVEGDGQWAVQLSAPRSEAEAKSAIARLKNKYADALGDSELAVRQAEVKGQTIYRVRVSGLSKADAGALCAKLKAGGGDCFIAKD